MQEEPFGCGLCKKAFTMAKYLAKHVELHHSRKNPQNKLNNENKINKLKPTTETAIPTHSETVHEERNYQCSTLKIVKIYFFGYQCKS